MTGKTAEERAAQRDQGSLRTRESKQACKDLDRERKRSRRRLGSLQAVDACRLGSHVHLQIQVDTGVQEDKHILAEPVNQQPRRRKIKPRKTSRAKKAAAVAAACANAASEFDAAAIGHAHNLLFLSEHRPPPQSSQPSLAVDSSLFATTTTPTAASDGGAATAHAGGLHIQSNALPLSNSGLGSLSCMGGNKPPQVHQQQQQQHLPDHSQHAGIPALPSQSSAVFVQASNSSAINNQHPPDCPQARARVHRHPTR